jgi:hypothetical protein
MLKVVLNIFFYVLLYMTWVQYAVFYEHHKKYQQNNYVLVKQFFSPSPRYYLYSLRYVYDINTL